MDNINNVNESERGKGETFKRTRRITGYLTTDTDTWNSAKIAELNDRVSHSVKED